MCACAAVCGPLQLISLRAPTLRRPARCQTANRPPGNPLSQSPVSSHSCLGNCALPVQRVKGVATEMEKKIIMQTPVAMAPWRLKSLSLCQPVPTPTSTTLTSTFPPLQPTFRAPLEEQSRALGGARPPGDALPPAKASPAAGCPGSGEEALKLDPAWGYDNGGDGGRGAGGGWRVGEER